MSFFIYLLQQNLFLFLFQENVLFCYFLLLKLFLVHSLYSPVITLSFCYKSSAKRNAKFFYAVNKFVMQNFYKKKANSWADRNTSTWSLIKPFQIPFIHVFKYESSKIKVFYTHCKKVKIQVCKTPTCCIGTCKHIW